MVFQYFVMFWQTLIGGNMIKTVGIVSLSSGIVGESFIRFESDIGIRRLKEYGLDVKFMPNALMGLDYIKAHPEK